MQNQPPRGRQSVWGRFITDIPIEHSGYQINKIIEQFMKTEGFRQTRYKGEPIFKKGRGFLAAPKCIKIEVRPGSVHIEAFVIMYLLRGFPNIRIGELNLDGPGGMKPIVGPKRVLRERVDRLIAVINNPDTK